MINHRKKHKILSYLSVLTVIGSQMCVPRGVRSAAVEAFDQGHCCAGQAFKYHLKKRFIRRNAVSCDNSSGNVYLTFTYNSAFDLVSSGASCGVNELRLRG